MSNFVRAVLIGNSFTLPLELKINGRVVHVDSKIDTGCSRSTVSLKTALGVSREKCIELKKQAISSGLPVRLGFGVNDSNEDRERMRNIYASGDLLNCKAVKFLYKEVSMLLDEYSFTHGICVNYDRDSSSLIGMDILKDFDFHCGKSLKTGEFVFLGCLCSKICSDYTKALQDELGIVFEHEFLAKFIRESI